MSTLKTYKENRAALSTASITVWLCGRDAACISHQYIGNTTSSINCDKAMKQILKTCDAYHGGYPILFFLSDVIIHITSKV